ncbi:MAG: response regulator [Proteobacteria bacterium]|nr:response regulator [Pseudomonadota bacterium]
MEPSELSEAEDLDRALRDRNVHRLQVVAVAVLAWSVIQVVVLLLRFDDHRLLAITLATIVAAAGALQLGRGPRLTSNELTGVGVALGIVQVAGFAGFARLTDEPAFFLVIPMCFIGAGFLMLYRAWLVAYFGVGTALALAIARLPDASIATDALLLSAGVFIGALLHVVGLRSVLRVEALLRRDRQHQRALEAALADARRELADSERAEVDRRNAEAEGAQLRTAPRPVVEGDPTLLTQALVNLCLNSVDAMRGVGRVQITATHVDVDATRATALEIAPGRYVAITVVDTGAGMSAETASRIFEPFFTTKDIGRGTGLGLPMVYGTVRSYGGGIDVASELGTGTTITLYLPPAELAPAAATIQVAPALATTGGTILLVDDDLQIRRLGRRILEGKGYSVLEAGDGRAALEIYQQHPEIQLVVLDMAMPVMGGAECFAALRKLDPDARVLLASGYTIEEDSRRCLAEGALGFLDKPYRAEFLIATIARVLRGERLRTTRDLPAVAHPDA